VLFTNTTSGGTGSNVYVYSENNTAGVTQSGNKLTFGDAGKYAVTITASDTSGETASATDLITVTPPLLITSFYATISLCGQNSNHQISAGQSLLFTNTTSGGTGSNVYVYSENNTAGVTQSGNKLTFGDAGKYAVTLTVKDASGETATATDPITVTPPLIITSFTATATQINVGQTVQFSSADTGGTGSNVYSFSINNTAGVTQNGNKLTFGDAGKYAVTLTVKDASGETATNTLVISVVQPTPPGCKNGNGGNAVMIIGSSKTTVVQITNQDAVQITGSSNNVTIIMPGSNCNIAVQVTGSSNKVNVYNGTITLTMTGSSNSAGLHNAVVSAQTITGSSNKVIGAILNGAAFTITGSTDLVESVQVEHLGSLQLTGSGANITIDMLTSNPTAITITGSSNVMHIINGTVSIRITGSSNNVYYSGTTITSQSITGSGNNIIKYRASILFVSAVTSMASLLLFT
jgi:formylmethanofuran dehydrogenase subunit E